MLGERLGIGHDPSQHVAYVASWIKALEEDAREVFRAAADAEKIVKLSARTSLGWSATATIRKTLAASRRKPSHHRPARLPGRRP